MKIAFDIDNTLYKIKNQLPDENGEVWYLQVPDYELVQVLKWFHNNGDRIFFWSAGGIDYCQTIVNKLGLHDLGDVVSKGSFTPDIAFDDEDTSLAKVDIKVKREILHHNG